MVINILYKIILIKKSSKKIIKMINSYIIDKLDRKVEVVIAVGYKSEQIKTYLDIVYNDKCRSVYWAL